MGDNLQVALGPVGKLLIQTLFPGSSEILYFVQILNSHRNFLHKVGSSDIRQTNSLRRIFKIFSGSPIHPRLGITKILLIDIRA